MQKTPTLVNRIQPQPDMQPSFLPAGYDYHVVTSSEFPALTFRFLKPADFRIVNLPAELPDFSQAARLMPLVVAVANYGPLIFSVAARPAYEDGTLEQWLIFLLREEGYTAGAIEETRLGDLPAVTCDALQHADDVTMKMRFVLLEDGGRLFQITAMAPEPVWASAIEKFAPMLAAFALREPHGTQVPLRPGSPPPDAPAKTKPIKLTKPAAKLVSGASSARLTDDELIGLALADDMASLDAEHPTNVRLRNRGIGLVPRVVTVDLARKSAWIAAGAVEGSFRLPLGWHTIDDGKRTLVFDPDGRIQVNLDQRLHEGLSRRDFALRCVQPYLREQPGLQMASIELDGIAGAGVRGAQIEGEILDQYFLARDLGRPGRYLVARVTAAAEDATRALNLAGDILATMEEWDIGNGRME